jgi:hypothetical protein
LPRSVEKPLELGHLFVHLGEHRRLVAAGKEKATGVHSIVSRNVDGAIPTTRIT